ncbi:MAG: MFS transporter [Bdellovibrionales bacterium]|nr:MFS transporter [Bdellovibrionales bacterium]
MALHDSDLHSEDLGTSHAASIGTKPLASCSSRSFIALLIAQLLGAFNDNLFKTVVSLLVIGRLAGNTQSVAYLSLTAALFFLPYILFSAFAGYLSDKHSKARVIQSTKFLEVAVMTLGLIGFLIESPLSLMLAVFLMGTQSALFGPAKYGILPEMLKTTELPKANGYIELTTFAAIIFGTAAAGLVSSGRLGNPGYACLLIALLGVLASLRIEKGSPPTVDVNFSWNPITPNLKHLKTIRADSGLWHSVVGTAFFWSLGALFQLNILLYSKYTLGMNDLQTSLLLAVLGFGIGIGSVIAGRVSEGNVELGLVPIGGIGMVLGTLALSFVHTSHILPFIFIPLLGMSSGFFIVPVQTYLQEYSPPETRGSYIAASNFLSFSAMLVISFLFWFASDVLFLSSNMIFLAMSFFIVGAAFYLLRLLPESLARCVNWILIHTIYRITTFGSENIPENGGGLIVCNHVTYVDAMILLASMRRPVRFIMYRPIYNSPGVYPLAKLMKAIPISGEDGRESLRQTLHHAAELIENGELVGIFAEGGLTRTGEIQEFRTGLETIMANLNAPIIPTHLGGLWGSIFSHEKGKVFWKWPRRIPYPVTVTFGSHLSSSTKASEVEQAVRELSDAYTTTDVRSED